MRLHWTWVFCEGAERAGDRRRTQKERRATVRSGSAVRENLGGGGRAEETGQGGGEGDQPGAVGRGRGRDRTGSRQGLL